MRTVITYIFFFIALSGFGQQEGSLAHLELVGSSCDSLVKAFLQIDKNGDGKYILVFKKDLNWDTLEFAGDGSPAIQDTCTIRTIQIDRKGLKEVIITWSLHMSHSYGGLGGGFENSYTMNEIWNLDTREKIFSAQNAYYNFETTVYAENDSADQIIRTVICSYSYDFAVTDNGQIVISNMKEDNSVTYGDDPHNKIKKEKDACSFSPPDHEEGVYIYKEGEFIWAEHKIGNDNKAKKDNPQGVIWNQSPPTAGLPFGPAISSSDKICEVNDQFYFSLIGKDFSVENGFKKFAPAYQLPPIEKYLYTIVDTNLDGNGCNNSIPVNDLIKITKFNIRLPDYEGFEVYYATGDAEHEKAFSEAFKNICENFYYRFYGILILYKKTTKTARLLPVFYNHYSESIHTRYFYIGNDYRILLCNSSFSEGDTELGNPVDKIVGPLYEVKILRNGDFAIKMLSGESALQ